MKFKWPFISQKRDRDMSDEMAFHIESTTRELVSAGMSETDARFEARRRFGSVLKQKEAGHEIRVGRFFEDILRDARFMARGLRRSPGFTLAVVLTLALGIGANTAIFSVVDQVLLRPLPYPAGRQTGDGVRASGRPSRKTAVSPANWLDWQRESRTLEGFAAWQTRSDTLTGAGEATQLRVQAVSHEFFPVLRVAPMLGRAISEDDDRPNAPPVARHQPSAVAEPLRRRSEHYRPLHRARRCAASGRRRDARQASASCTRTIDRVGRLPTRSHASVARDRWALHQRRRAVERRTRTSTPLAQTWIASVAASRRCTSSTGTRRSRSCRCARS